MKVKRHIEKVVRHGKVAVLVSPGYGAGWSTWNDAWHICLAEDRVDLPEFMLFHADLIRMKEANAGEKKVKAYMESVFGTDRSVCIIAWPETIIQWVPVGTMFRVVEDDGSEAIVRFNPAMYYTA
mgnify:FL=1